MMTQRLFSGNSLPQVDKGIGHAFLYILYAAHIFQHRAGNGPQQAGILIDHMIHGPRVPLQDSGDDGFVFQELHLFFFFDRSMIVRRKQEKYFELDISVFLRNLP